MGVQKRRIYEKLKQRDGLSCGICKQSLEAEWAQYQEWLGWSKRKDANKPKAPMKRSKLSLTVDHIYPKSLARTNGWLKERTWALTNLQLAHKACNVKKGNAYEENGTEGVVVLPEVRPPVLVDETTSDILPRREESGLVPEVRSGQGEGVEEKISWPERVKIEEKRYNSSARMWNSIPGERLEYPRDAFKIKYHHKDYCPEPVNGHKRGDLVLDFLPLKVCYNCGLPYKGEYDS